MTVNSYRHFYRHFYKHFYKHKKLFAAGLTALMAFMPIMPAVQQVPATIQKTEATQKTAVMQKTATTQEPAATLTKQAVQKAEAAQKKQAMQETDMGMENTRQITTLAPDAKELTDYKLAAILPAPETAEAQKITYNSVTLSWSKVEGAVSYRIEYSSDGSSYTVAGQAAADASSYKCKKLKTGTEYQFRVCAIDKAGKAGNYALAKATPYLNKTKFTDISAPKLQAISLKWKKVAGATNYQLYRKAATEDTYKLIAVTPETAYMDKTVTADADYSYRVCAVREVDGKTVKAKLSAATGASFTMPTSQITTCEAASYHSVKLAWTQADSASGYYIYRSVKEDGTYRKIKTVKGNTVLAYTDANVVPGKKFYYKICAYVQAADKTVTPGELSAAVSAQTQAEAPQFVAVNTNVSNRSLALEWKKSEGAAGYRIYRSESPDKGFAKITDRESGTFVGYEDRAVTPGKTYYYQIKAIYINGSYKGLSMASDVLEGKAAPSAPIGLTVEQAGTDTLKISWQESGGADSYSLYRAEAGDGKYQCVAQGLAETAYTDSGLKDGQAYFYRVSAAGAGGEGMQCHAVSYTVGGVSINTRTLKLCVGVSRPLEISTFRQGQAVWKSDDPKVAEVTSNGTVTGISYGTATITATVSGKSATATVSVVPGSKNGIDVSRWQEDVDWQRVKASGVEFAFLRISNHYLEDFTFETKYVNASSVGMPLGVYCYSRATTAEEAKEEARIVLELLNGRRLDYPIALDMEDEVHKSGSMTKENLHQMILAFKQVVEDAGYQFVLYSYVSFFNTNLDNTKLGGIDLWIARYANVSAGTGYNGTGKQKYWQYNSGQYDGSNSQVDGITDEAGNLVPVDVNIEY